MIVLPSESGLLLPRPLAYRNILRLDQGDNGLTQGNEPNSEYSGIGIAPEDRFDLTTNAVFISYASQDAAAAERIASALRVAGIEVWFDQAELRGGDVWDASIRKQIRRCGLFVPIISRNTHVRDEGYFRLEWKLAVDRSHLMAADKAFLLPVVIDNTRDDDERVPERFREVQWTRLPAGETPSAFIERVRGLTPRTHSLSSLEPVHTPPHAAAIIDINKGEKTEQDGVRKSSRRKKSNAWMWTFPAMLLIVAGILLVQQWQKKEHARNELLPAIQKMAGTTFRSNGPTFDMAVAVEKYLPGNPILTKLWPDISTSLSVSTEPAGAEVLWKDYSTPTADWRKAGITPFKAVKVPRTYLRLEIRKSGYQTIEYATPGFDLRIPPTDVHLKLDPLGSLPENMVRIPSDKVSLNIVGFAAHADTNLNEFLVDKFEVTNKQFKAFIDAGGYASKAFWLFPIVADGKVIPLEAALAKFTDRTGRLGPSTWEAGSYPDGTENHPVTGVSWYEAAAFAAYAKKQLPTVYHWSAVADTTRSEFITPLSNFSGISTNKVGTAAGFSTYGVYDLAGNAREWTFNQSGDPNQRYIMGGGWNDQIYTFNEGYTLSPLNRSNSNGFRCIKTLPGDLSMATLQQPLARSFRDYSNEKPVDDKTFAIYARQFLYDKSAVAATNDKTIEDELWKADVVSIDAGYNGERMQVYLYFPRSFTGPREAVIYFPGSSGVYYRQYDPASINHSIAFIVKSGRALIVPIFKGTYQRHDNLENIYPTKSFTYKDHVIFWGKEIGRTIDYLETRKDIQADKIGYLGFSWGGRMGGIYPAIEKRIKVIVLNVGGLSNETTLPEVDGINYLPRITQPVLMLNDKYDIFYSYEEGQKTMFNMLGTPTSHKKIVIFESGHIIPQSDYIRETLAWLDTYLGPVH